MILRLSASNIKQTTMQLLDGKKQKISRAKLLLRSKNERQRRESSPFQLMVGNDGASLTYVGSKVKACERVGFESH
jgi:methylenetetrahydrofolate dehydrogenase (NADP+)/methenyltetrahydrofolate cyclohydrolase